MEPVRLGVRRDAGTASGLRGTSDLRGRRRIRIIGGQRHPLENRADDGAGADRRMGRNQRGCAGSGGPERVGRGEDQNRGRPVGRRDAGREGDRRHRRRGCGVEDAVRVPHRAGRPNCGGRTRPGHGVFTADYGELERHLSALQEGEPQNWGDRWRGARIEIPKPQSDGDGGGPATAAYVVEEIGCTYRGVLKSAGSEKTRNEYAPGTAWIPRRVITALKRRPMAAPNGAGGDQRVRSHRPGPDTPDGTATAASPGRGGTNRPRRQDAESRDTGGAWKHGCTRKHSAARRGWKRSRRRGRGTVRTTRAC